MFIASKVEEIYSPEINDFVYITDNAYSSAEIREMELRMLRTLGFNFSRPHPLHFLRRNSKAGMYCSILPQSSCLVSFMISKFSSILFINA